MQEILGIIILAALVVVCIYALKDKESGPDF